MSVVELPANVTIRRDDGLTATTDMDQGLITNDPGDNYTYTAVELPDSARLHGQYTLEPGEEKRTSIKELPPDFVVVVVVYQDENEIISWVSAGCDDLALVALGVSSYPDPPGGVKAAYTCS